MEAKVFLGGIPYGPDVKLLEEAFPPPLEEGRIITHQELSAVIGVRVGTGRYYGVVDSWRKKMQSECGLNIEWERGEGVKVLNPAEYFSATVVGIRRGAVQFGRRVNRLKWVPRGRLDSSGQKVFDHVLLNSGKAKAALADNMKQMAIELPAPKSLPKPKLIRESA